MREFLVILRDRGYQRLDHLVLHEVGKIAAAHRAFMAAPVVLDPFILGERVGYQREQFDVIPKFLAERLGGALPNRAVRIVEIVHRVRQGQAFSVDLEPKTRHGFIEQPRPGPPTDNGLLVKRFFKLVRQPIRRVNAGVPNPGGVARRRRVLQLFGEGILRYSVEFEIKKDDGRSILFTRSRNV